MPIGSFLTSSGVVALINFLFGLAARLQAGRQPGMEVLPAFGGQHPSKILIFTLKKPSAENWY